MCTQHSLLSLLNGAAFGFSVVFFLKFQVNDDSFVITALGIALPVSRDRVFQCRIPGGGPKFRGFGEFTGGDLIGV